MTIFRRTVANRLDAFWESLPSDFKSLFEGGFGRWADYQDDEAKLRALTVFFDEVEKQRERVFLRDQLEDLLSRLREIQDRNNAEIRMDIRSAAGVIHERISDVREIVRLSGEATRQALSESKQQPLQLPHGNSTNAASQPITVFVPSTNRGDCQYPTHKTRPTGCIRYEVRPDGTWARCDVADQVRANQWVWDMFTTVYERSGCPSTTNPFGSKCPFIKNEWVRQ